MSTFFKKAIRLPIKFGRWYDRKLIKYPLPTRMVTYFFIFGTGDLVSQFIGNFNAFTD